MILKLYNTSDSNNTIGKTLQDEETYDITFKDTFDILTPVILLKSSTPILKNYAYLPELERYYFITSIQVQPNEIYRLMLECDVLASKGLVSRTKEGNKFYDGGLNSEVRTVTTTFESTKEIDYKNEVVLITVR